MATYQQLLKEGEQIVRKKGLEASAVKLLLLHFSQLSNTDLYLSLHQECPSEDAEFFKQGIRQYVEEGVPVQYIIGYVYFYGYRFFVSPTVLIPRFETEELVANVLIHYDEMFQGQIVDCFDIGTGSGCLAISLKLEEPNLQVWASDISDSALAMAKKNAQALGADVTFYQGDLLEPFQGRKADIIVSNPPYIPDDEVVDPIIKNNEPHLALFGGKDGLKFYHKILEQAKTIVRETFLIAFEHAYDKAEELRAIAAFHFPDASIHTEKDLQGKDRMTFIKRVRE